MSSFYCEKCGALCSDEGEPNGYVTGCKHHPPDIINKDYFYIGNFRFPTNCPDNCLYKQDLLHQGSFCNRCPIFNCVPTLDEDGIYFSLLRPSEFNLKLARWYFEVIKKYK